MMQLFAGLLAGLVVSPSAPQGQVAPGGIDAPPEPPGIELALRPGEMLLDHTWDGGFPVPSLAGGPGVFVPFGGRGRGPATRFLLGSERLDGVVLTGATLLEALNLQGAPGRIGAGIEFRGDSRLRVAFVPADDTVFGWSLMLWMRPLSHAFGRPFALLEGSARLVLALDGRLRVEWLDGAPALTSASPLIPEAWNAVGLSLDGLLVRHVRLITNGDASGRALGPGEPLRRPAGLVLGDIAGSGSGFAGTLDELRLDDVPGTTESLLEGLDLEPTGGPHTLRARTSRGLRSEQMWTGAHRQPVVETAPALTNGWLDGTSVVDGRLTWTPGRWHELKTINPPPPRTTHPLADLGDGRVLVFGGETRDSHLWPGVNTGDTWILDTARETWRQVLGPGPAPRCHIPAATSPEHGLVLLVCGWRNDVSPGLQYSDTWVFHVGTERWEQRFPVGATLPATSDHVLVWHPGAGVFVMLQGLAVRTYDPLADRWTALPSPRVVDTAGAPSDYVVAGSTAAILDPVSGRIVLQGGEFSASMPLTYHDRTAYYDLASNTLTVVDPPVRPSARARAAFAYDPRTRRGVYFGGTQDQRSTRFDDLWTLDLATLTWKSLEASGAPTARGGFYGMAFDQATGRFVLPFGRESFERWADDTLVLAIDDHAPGRAVYVFDRALRPGRNTWFLDADTPGDSRATAWFRTGGDGVHWGDWSPASSPAHGARFLQVGLVLRPGSNGEIPSVSRFGFR
jgi:hypothetical protein